MGSSWALKFLCIFYPSGASSSGFALFAADGISLLPFAGLEIFAPKGLDFFAGRVPSEKKTFPGLGKH